MNPLYNPKAILMNMLQIRNPQAFNQINQLIQSGANPQTMLNNIIGQLSPQQKQQFDNVVNQFGLKR